MMGETETLRPRALSREDTGGEYSIDYPTTQPRQLLVVSFPCQEMRNVPLEFILIE